MSPFVDEEPYIDWDRNRRCLLLPQIAEEDTEMSLENGAHVFEHSRL